ncbi:MAG: peptidylprolyl isomerase, partial [Cyclobacteriaceae bacterium]|nr:peptidylprolyl isomerase [Cyclobacteriaceae bacterium]
MRILISFLVAFAFCSITFGQKTVKNKPEILFTINDVEKVNKEEFVYMYKKNNFNNNKGYTKEDIGDYLNLYQIFKLKIVEAKQLGYDTTKAFKSEFNKYKNQLTDNYLRTNKITDSLINEAYLRYKEKIKASHILIKLDKNASPQDTLKAYMRIIEIREKAILENNFGELAQQFSDDPSAKTNKGDLSYFSSMNMVYPFETAAYNTPVGKISTPVRTQFGYHIIKVVDRSPNYKVEVAHIMVRVKNGEDKNAKDKIFDIHDQLNNGVEWEVACRQFSEDINTKNNKGKLKPFGVGQMPPSFQEIAFSLKNPNEYSDPFTTPYGWHIVKYIGKHEIESFDKIKPQIENRIKKDERVAISKKLLLLRLKKENNFLKKEVNNLESLFNETLLKGNWSNTNDEDFILFTINSEEYKFSNFSQYVKDNQKEIKGNSLEE